MQRLCGASEMRHLTLVTTRWASTSDGEEQEKQVRREQSLKEEYWRDAIKHGAFIERHDGTKSQASVVVSVLNSRKELFLPSYKAGPSDFREQELQIAMASYDKKLTPTDEQMVPAAGKISTPLDKIPAAREARPAYEDVSEGLCECASIDATSFWTASSHEFWPHWASIWSLRSATFICADPKAMALVVVLKSLSVLASQFMVLIAAAHAAGIGDYITADRISIIVASMSTNWLLWGRSAVALDTLADAECTSCPATAWHTHQLPALLYRASPFVYLLFLVQVWNHQHGFKALAMSAIWIGCLYLQYTYVW
jgi:hypothetical protein